MTNSRMLKCPVDGAELQKIVKSGIEIEYCPSCGGVWLDHGELEKLVELASNPQPKFGPPNISSPAPAPQQVQHKHYSDDDHKHGYSSHQGHHKKKKDNWLGEIFDF